MAQSLVCKDCNTFLRSVKEAQDHAEATGHSNFEESVEPVKRLVCTECGKTCRTETEKDLHVKRTGHNSFEDKTGTGEAPAINTEVEMKEARDELMAEAGIAAPAAKESADAELVPAEVDENLLNQLVEMGFDRNRSIRAIYNSGGEAIDAAIAWLADHEGDTDLDEPLMVPKATSKTKLTPEEAKEQAKELLRKARAKREAEERETERLRELERIRMGKELAAMAKKEEEDRLRRNMEERQREKEEEERAREKIRRKLEEDRRERRRKLGLPEELTEEEKEAERQKEREKAEAEARRRLPVKPVAKSEKMRDYLVGMKKAHPGQDDGLKTCWNTLLKMVSNIGLNPTEEKYRRIRLSNPAIQQRVAAYTNAVEFLQVCGFERDASGENLEMPAEAVDRLVLEAAAENLNSALNNPFFGAL